MVGTHNAFSVRYLYTFWCDYVVLYMVGTLNAFSARYLYTFFGVIMLCCIWLALSMHFRRGICILFWCDYVAIWLALSMHFRRGICILFWCDYVGLYMVGTLNAFLARYLYNLLV